MADEALRILLVEDNPAEAQLLQRALSDTLEQPAVTHVEQMSEALAHLEVNPVDAVLLDLSLPDSRGLESVERAHAAVPHLPILVLTGTDDEALATEAVRRGAQDYLIKGQADGRTLSRAIRYAIERQRADEQIHKLNRELEDRVNQRTAQLRAMAFELTQVEHRERRRLAEVLHEHLQQLLVAAKLRLSMLRRRTEDGEMIQFIGDVDSLLDQSIRSSRSLTVELSPPVLYDAGLAPALDWLARWMHDKYGLTVRVEADRESQPESTDVAALLFLFVRELLFNVVKHANTENARVTMCRRGQEQVAIGVSDDGVGFLPREATRGDGASAGFGLFSIRERLQSMGGRLEVDSAPGKGTRVSMVAPLNLPGPSAL